MAPGSTKGGEDIPLGIRGWIGNLMKVQALQLIVKFVHAMMEPSMELHGKECNIQQMVLLS